jgi:TatD DNase family protein
MSSMKYIDQHCHLSDERVFDRAETLIQDAVVAGVETMVLAGVEPSDWKRQIKLKSRYPELLKINFGLHPWWVERYSPVEIEDILAELDEQLEHATGLGETGLDFYEKRDPKRFKDQKSAFRHQIQIAKKHRKPLILHVVQAHDEAIKILVEEEASSVPILLHSYSGNVTQMQEYLKLGAYLSFNGTLVKIIEGRGHEKTLKALMQAPRDRILFETDSPDQGWGEKKSENTPAKIVDVYAAAAEILSLDLVELVAQVQRNFNSFYAVRG